MREQQPINMWRFLGCRQSLGKEVVAQRVAQRGGRNRRSAQFGAIWSVICQQRVLYTSRVVTTLLYIPLLKGASAKLIAFSRDRGLKNTVWVN